MSFPKLKSNFKVAIRMLCDDALRSWNPNLTEQEVKFTCIAFLNVVRMLRWMEIGGYREHHMDDTINVAETNEICLSLLKEMNLDAKILAEQILVLTEPSPFTLDADVLQTIKEFLTRLSNNLKAN